MNDYNQPEPHLDPESPLAYAAEIPSGIWPHDALDLGYWAFRTMWLQPRVTIRQIVNVNPEYHVNLLIALGGIAESLDRASVKNFGDKYSLGTILASALVLGPIGALIGAWVYAHLIRITGDWLGGRGDYDEIKAALGWSSLPTAVGLALWVPLLALFGLEAFSADTASLRGNVGLAIAFAGLTTGLSVLNLWSFVLFCHAIAEVQHYESAWKGLGNIILAGALFIVPVLLFVGAFVALLAMVAG